MKSLLVPGLACVVLLSGSVASAQPAVTSFEARTSYQRLGEVAPLRAYSTRTSGYSGYGYGEAPVLDRSSLDRTSVVELPGRGLPDAELNRRLKDDEPLVAPEVKPRPKPKSEQAARDEFYRRLHRHADGRGTLEEVEDAYRDLLPFRR
ncbi:MAG: hypothetical protein ACC642_12030 [Pseudomonadales bacterium]